HKWSGPPITSRRAAHQREGRDVSQPHDNTAPPASPSTNNPATALTDDAIIASLLTDAQAAELWRGEGPRGSDGDLRLCQYFMLAATKLGGNADEASIDRL